VVGAPQCGHSIQLPYCLIWVLKLCLAPQLDTDHCLHRFSRPKGSSLEASDKRGRWEFRVRSFTSPNYHFQDCGDNHKDFVLVTESTLLNAESTLPNVESTLPNTESTLPNAESTLPNIKRTLPNTKSTLPNAKSTL